MNLPDNLPPPPSVPPGFDRWRRTCDPFATGPLIRLFWPTGWKKVKEFDHDYMHLEAVREPAEVPACPECVQGYVQETGFDRCDKCNPAASGVEARVCEWQSIKTAPRDGTEIIVYCPPAHGLRHMASVCAWHEHAGFCVDELREPTLWQPLPPAERSDHE